MGEELSVRDLADMKEELQRALAAYKTAHTKAIKRLYRHYPSNLLDEHDFSAESVKPEKGVQPYVKQLYPFFHVRPNPVARNDEIFLIYYFCFNLEEFAKEQIYLINAFGAIRHGVH